MGLRCQCGKPVHFANVNNATETAKCPSCGAVFSTARPLGVSDPPAAPEAFTTVERVEILAGASSYRASARPGGGKRWRYSGFRWSYVFGVVGCVVVDGDG